MMTLWRLLWLVILADRQVPVLGGLLTRRDFHESPPCSEGLAGLPAPMIKGPGARLFGEEKEEVG
jgi:hypothetical protein